jgi:uncharacterized protein DUF4190
LEEETLMSNAPTSADQAAGGATLALVSLLFGVGCFVPGIGVIAAPIAVITGILALRRSKRYPAGQTNRGLAIAGIVLGCVSLALYLLVVLILLLPSFGIHDIRILS